MKRPDKYQRAASELLQAIEVAFKSSDNLDRVVEVVAARLRLSEAEGKVLAADEISVAMKGVE